MNQQEILRKIGGIIVELKEQHTYLQANSSSFNDLELELFMANANFLTDHIDILKKIHGNAKSVAALPVAQPETMPPTKPVIPDYFSEEEHLPFADDPFLQKLNSLSPIKEPEPEQEQATTQEILQDKIVSPEQTPEEEAEVPAPFTIADTSFTAQNSVPTYVMSASEETFAAPKPETVNAVKAEPEVEHVQENTRTEPIVFEEELKPIMVEPELPKVNTLKEEFIKTEAVKTESDAPLTLNERIAAQKGLAQPTAKVAVTGTAVQDLQSLITLNDKLLFVKELFNGYNLAYSEAINILNRYTNFDQAEQFLKANYAGKNNWKDKPATAERFFDILKQRFA
jgi:hypothetical protein